MRLRGIKFHPVLNAPGARGFFGRPYWYYPIWRLLGLSWWKSSFVAKTTTHDARTGNMPLGTDGDRPREKLPRCILITLRSFLSGHIANAVSWSGPGAKFLLDQDVWQKLPEPFIISLAAVCKTREERKAEYLKLCDLLSQYVFRTGFALQMTLGCPNVGLPFESLRDEIKDMLQIMSLPGIPLILNFNPLVPAKFLKELEDTGLCDAFWIGNTIPYDHDGLGERIFGQKISPLLKRGLPVESAGGISGLACLKYTLATIRQARALGVTLPIIASNGIQSPLGVWRAWKAGADAVAVGTVAMIRPFMMIPIIITAHLLFGLFGCKKGAGQHDCPGNGDDS